MPRKNIHILASVKNLNYERSSAEIDALLSPIKFESDNLMEKY